MNHHHHHPVPSVPMPTNNNNKQKKRRFLCCSTTTTTTSVILIALVPIVSYWNVFSAQTDIRNIMVLLQQQQQQQQQQQPSIVASTISTTTMVTTIATTSTTTTTTGNIDIPHTNEDMGVEKQQDTVVVVTQQPTLRGRKRNSPPTQMLMVNRTITILLQYKGELGNHLSIIAGAYVTRYKLQQRYPYITIQFIGQHQDHTKWIRAQADLQRCFPNVISSGTNNNNNDNDNNNDNFNFNIFDGGPRYDPHHFLPVQQQQNKWLTKQQQRSLTNVHTNQQMDLLHRLLYAQQYKNAPQQLQQQPPPPPPPPQQMTMIMNDTTTTTTTTMGKYNYSLPYLIADTFVWQEILHDIDLYHEIRHLFVLNESACCTTTTTTTTNTTTGSSSQYQYRQQQLNTDTNDTDSDTDVNDTDSNDIETIVVRPIPHDILYYHRNFNKEVSAVQIKKMKTVFTEVTPYMASTFLLANHTVNTTTSMSNTNDTTYDDNNHDDMVDYTDDVLCNNNNNNNETNSNSDHSSTTISHDTNYCHTNNKRVAILSRSVDGLDAYQHAFKETNHLSSYIVHHTMSSTSSRSRSSSSSGMIDFCYIVNADATNEIVGKLHSTFLEWSSLLSNASMNRYYTINDTPITNVSSSSSSSSLPPPRMKIVDHIVIDERQFIFEEYWQPSNG